MFLSRISILFSISLLCFNFVNNTFTEQDVNPMEETYDPNSPIVPITIACSKIKVSGMNLIAICRMGDGSLRIAEINLNPCIHNYDGELSYFYNEELISFKVRNCYIEDDYLICQCEQPSDGYSKCDAMLNYLFAYNKLNNKISCQ